MKKILAAILLTLTALTACSSKECIEVAQDVGTPVLVSTKGGDSLDVGAPVFSETEEVANDVGIPYSYEEKEWVIVYQDEHCTCRVLKNPPKEEPRFKLWERFEEDGQIYLYGGQVLCQQTFYKNGIVVIKVPGDEPLVIDDIPHTLWGIGTRQDGNVLYDCVWETQIMEEEYVR